MDQKNLEIKINEWQSRHPYAKLEMDQKNLEIKINEWQSRHPYAKFFRICSEISSEDSKSDISDTCGSETSFVDEVSERNALFVH